MSNQFSQFFQQNITAGAVIALQLSCTKWNNKQRLLFSLIVLVLARCIMFDRSAFQMHVKCKVYVWQVSMSDGCKVLQKESQTQDGIVKEPICSEELSWLLLTFCKDRYHRRTGKLDFSNLAVFFCLCSHVPTPPKKINQHLHAKKFILSCLRQHKECSKIVYRRINQQAANIVTWGKKKVIWFLNHHPDNLWIL